MNLLPKIIAYLEGRGVPSALIGGVALAAHGIARSTLDSDLLVDDRAVLESGFWAAWDGPQELQVRRGDVEDPLAGVVRLAQGEEVVDIIVGKHAWEAEVLKRRVYVTVEGNSLPTVDRADLVLLKLFAGGPQDLLDVRLLLAADKGDLRREVERRVVQLPTLVQATWKDLLASGTE